MSISNGSCSMTRFYAKTPGSPRAIFTALEKEMIVPLQVKDTNTFSIGWADPYSGDDEISPEIFSPGSSQVVFGLRVDRKKIPGSTFRLQLRAALQALTGEEGRRVPKKIKDAVRERIQIELLQNTVPATSLTQVVWDLDTDELWVDSTSKATLDVFDELFIKTFGTLLLPKTAGVLALKDIESQTEIEALLEVMPANLYRGYDHE